jgi:hypothetical protein
MNTYSQLRSHYSNYMLTYIMQSQIKMRTYKTKKAVNFCLLLLINTFLFNIDPISFSRTRHSDKYILKSFSF